MHWIIWMRCFFYFSLFWLFFPKCLFSLLDHIGSWGTRSKKIEILSWKCWVVEGKVMRREKSQREGWERVDKDTRTSVEYKKAGRWIVILEAACQGHTRLFLTWWYTCQICWFAKVSLSSQNCLCRVIFNHWSWNIDENGCLFLLQFFKDTTLLIIFTLLTWLCW